MTADDSTLEKSELPILLEGDPRLRTPCAAVKATGPDLVIDANALAATLAGFRRRHGFGRAIAAPQVGIMRRLIVMDLGAGAFVLVNPELVWRSADMVEVWDDCLSVPDKLVRLLRHRSVSVRYLDASFRVRTWERLPPDLAELLQHEIDHLDGILMTDRALGADAVRHASERALLIDKARPAHHLSLANVREAARLIDPLFLSTPKFNCETLSNDVGCKLTLKVET